METPPRHGDTSVIDELLRHAVASAASDIHLTVFSPPVFRVHGRMTRVGDAELKPEDLERILLPLLTPERHRRLEETGQVDFTHSISGVGRFRVNLYRQRGSLAAVFRVIPGRVPSPRDLNLPPVIAQLARCHNGLILVTGPTGSGKSTTLAAMIDLINSEQAVHILTLEDPIEYLHRHKKSIINQREIGQDSRDFSQALRAALRQDPDVILVGEMRDIETISIALTAAETGHLVMATLHTMSAAQTIDRVVNVFPPHQRDQVRVQLAAVLQGVISQTLLRCADSRGRVAAFEILVATPAVRNLIREGKTHQIPSAIQTGGRYGMVMMEAYLRNLLDSGVITQEEFQSRLNMEGGY